MLAAAPRRPSGRAGLQRDGPLQVHVVRDDTSHPTAAVAPEEPTVRAAAATARPTEPLAEAPRRDENVNQQLGPLVAPLTPTSAESADAAAFNRVFLALPAAQRGRFLSHVADSPAPIPPWRPGRARPIVCGAWPSKYGVVPAYFSLMPGAIASHVEANKSQDWSQVVPGLKRTYVYGVGDEETYAANMRQSLFGMTVRKGGWQSARTLELLAAGTVPWFCDVWDAPKAGSLAPLPRAVLAAVLHWPGVAVRCFPRKRFARQLSHAALNATLYTRVAAKLLEYTRSVLTAPYVARYMLSALSLTDVPRKVLVVWTSGALHPGYLMPTFMAGMKSLGVTVADTPRQADIYATTPDCNSSARLGRRWGRGYFSFCRVPEMADEVALRARVDDAVDAREFDAVYYHYPHETYIAPDAAQMPPPSVPVHLAWRNTSMATWPHLERVLARYPRDRIGFVSDADLLEPMRNDFSGPLLSRLGVWYRRETHGCGEEINAPRARAWAWDPSQDVGDGGVPSPAAAP